MRKITDQVILVTGATDGLGKQVAGDLAKKGAIVLLHGRNRMKGETVLQAIQNQTSNSRGRFYQADFASLGVVRKLAQVMFTFDLAGVTGKYFNGKQPA